MKRREFIALLGGTAAAWPLAVRAQKAMPTVGFLYTAPTPGEAVPYVTAPFLSGLREVGFVRSRLGVRRVDAARRRCRL